MAGGAPRIDGCDDLVPVGTGGFSTVYRATQRQFDRTVAIKIIEVDLQSDGDRERFLEECRIAGRVSRHPHIVTVLDGGVSPDGRPYIVSEFMTGGSLGDRLDEDGPRSADEVVATGIKLCGALAAIHAAGITHADIKPDNVLVSEFGEPALWDFGVSARVESAATPSTGGEVALTFNHAAPERYHGDPPSVAADIYALCSTLYTLATGAPPFATAGGAPLAVTVGRVLHEEVPVPTTDLMPTELFEVLRVGLSKSPDDRPPTAVALGEALQATQSARGAPPTPMVLSGDPTTSPPRTNPGGRAGVGPARGRRLVLAATLAALLLLLLGVLWVRVGRDAGTVAAGADPKAAASAGGPTKGGSDETSPTGGVGAPDGRNGADGAVDPGATDPAGGADRADGATGAGAPDDPANPSLPNGATTTPGGATGPSTSGPTVVGVTTTTGSGPNASAPSTTASPTPSTASTIRPTTSVQATTTTVGSRASVTATPAPDTVAHIPLHGTLYIVLTNVGAPAGSYTIAAPSGTTGGATGTGTVPGYSSRTISITDNGALPRTFTVNGSFTGTASYHLTVFVGL